MQKFVSTAEEIEDLIKAAYPMIYVVSPEEERVEALLKDIGGRRNRNLVIWSITEGFSELESPGKGAPQVPKDVKDPLRALENIEKYEGNAIFILRDYHPYLTDPTIVRRLRDLCKSFTGGKTKNKKHIILLSSVFKAPLEIEKDMAVVDYDLPDEHYIGEIFEDTLGKIRFDPKFSSIVKKYDENPVLKEEVVKAALGLTANEVRSVYGKSLVRAHDFDIDTILSEKKHIIRKSGILEFYQTTEQFSDIGGLETLKNWLTKRKLAFHNKAKDFGLPVPKGILLIGVPGCGKSLTAKAVGSLWQMPLLRLDVGKVFSSLVGSSEENIRRAIRTAEAVAPSILWLDELEKGFSGAKSSHESDAGTTARVFASFITWLQEKTTPVFVIATANDVTMLPPELLRKGRFDEIFFVDLPNPNERKDIFKIHIERINRRSKIKRDINSFDLEKLVESTQQFSGAEIEQALVSALFDAFEANLDLATDGLIKSVREIIPLSYTMKERIDEMREWANSRARRASLLWGEEKKESPPAHKLEPT
jgi:ATP-dependent 26S proteasome regulatory subunit